MPTTSTTHDPFHEEQAPAKSTRLSELDRLRLENASLKLMVIGQQFEKLSQERLTYSKAFDELRRECVERYGVDPAHTKIDAEGNFLGPISTPMMGPQAMHVVSGSTGSSQKVVIP